MLSALFPVTVFSSVVVVTVVPAGVVYLNNYYTKTRLLYPCPVYKYEIKSTVEIFFQVTIEMPLGDLFKSNIQVQSVPLFHLYSLFIIHTHRHIHTCISTCIFSTSLCSSLSLTWLLLKAQRTHKSSCETWTQWEWEEVLLHL